MERIHAAHNIAATKIVESEETLSPGSIVAERYQILDFCGRGEYGEVYACRHLDLPNLVLAARVMDPADLSCPRRSARLWNDLQTGYLLDDPNIARYYSHHIQDRHLVAVREYLDGGSLAAVMAGRSLRISEIVSILSSVTAGLSAVHDSDIVHCDLSSCNVLVSRDLRTAKLKGFGWALFRESPLSWPGAASAKCRIALTPEYRLSRAASSAGDIYCLGLLAYEMLCGKEPPAGRALTPPSEIRHGCPRGLSKFVMRCLAADPGERFRDAREARMEIESMRGSLTLTSIRAIAAE